MTIEKALEELDTLIIPRDGEQDRLADAFDMAVEALSLKERILERKSYLYYKDNPTEAEKAEYYALERLLEVQNDE